GNRLRTPLPVSAVADVREGCSIRSGPACAASVLLVCVGQVVEVEGLAVAVDPGRDDAEAVESGAARLEALSQVEGDRTAVQCEDNPTPATGAGGVISQRPVVGGAVGVDVGCPGRSMPVPTALDPIGGGEQKPLSAGAVRGDAKEGVGQAIVLGRAHGHAVP